MADLMSGRGSIKASRLRVARLDANGGTPSGATNSYVSSSLVKLTVTPEVLAGPDLQRQNAAGDYCIDVKDADRTRWLNLELEICEPDPQLLELLVRGVALLTDTTDTVGFQYPPLGIAQNDYGVSLELWTWNVNNGKQDGTYPWIRWALPLTKDWRMGARNFDNAPMDNVLSGRAFENSGWGNGPNNDWVKADGITPFASDRVLQAKLDRASAIPAAATGYTATPVQV